MCFALEVMSQSATVNSARWTSVERGRRWMPDYNCYVPAFECDFHVNLDVHGARGQETMVVIYFEQPKGVVLKDRNGQFVSSDGVVSASTRINPGYDNTHYDDLVVSIPQHELDGVNTSQPFFANILVYSGNRFLSNGYYLQVGGSQQNSGSGSYSAPQSDNTCYQCNNTRKCNNCYGRGTVYNPVGNGRTVTCYSCNGSGRCHFCQ